MTKPTTSYTQVAKNTTTFANVAKNTTSYATIAKSATSFATITKSITSYIGSTADSGQTLLNSSTVTLGSLTVYMNGYTTSTTPSQTGTKNLTSYATI